MKNKILKILILVLMIILFMQIEIFASELTLNITTDKQEIKEGNKFTITVDWTEEMQAADFYLKYDSEKLKFIKADISEDYMNSEDKGTIKTAWVSLDDTNKTKISYTFKAKASGITEFKTEINGGFATGELKIPDKYKEGYLSIEIGQQSFGVKALKIVLIVVIAFVVIRILIKIIKGKKGHVKKYFK